MVNSTISSCDPALKLKQVGSSHPIGKELTMLPHGLFPGIFYKISGRALSLYPKEFREQFLDLESALETF